MLCNTEAWYCITKAELELLESVDVTFLRKLLNAPRATPKEMLYLELGCIPFRELIIKRRILFMHYIVNEKPESMIRNFFETQLKNEKPKDWVNTVKRDLKDLKLEVDIEKIQVLKKSALKRILNKAILNMSLTRLNEIKANHSKVQKLGHEKLKMQNYLKANNHKMSQNESETIFKMRSRVSNVKTNYRGRFENFECSLCNEDMETQQHIIECKSIRNVKKTEHENVNYENLYGENVKQQLKIAKLFIENMNIKSKLEQKV